MWRSDHHLAGGRWYRSRQLCGAGQILINPGGASATFSDSPNDQRLTAASVTADEHTIHIGGIVLVPPQVAALVERAPELGDDSVALRTGEAHRHKDEFGGNLSFSTLDGSDLAALESHFRDSQGGHVAVVVTNELRCRHRVDPLPRLLMG